MLISKSSGLSVILFHFIFKVNLILFGMSKISLILKNCYAQRNFLMGFKIL